MLNCTVLYWAVLGCTALHRTLLYCTVLYRSEMQVLYCWKIKCLYYIVLHCTCQIIWVNITILQPGLFTTCTHQSSLNRLWTDEFKKKLNVHCIYCMDFCKTFNNKNAKYVLHGVHSQICVINNRTMYIVCCTHYRNRLTVSCNFKWPSMQRWQCPIYNGTHKSVVWSIMIYISMFLLL